MMLEATNGKLFFAPIGDYPQKILDLGTGTGIWAIEGMMFSSRDDRSPPGEDPLPSCPCRHMVAIVVANCLPAAGDMFPSAEVTGLDLSPIQPVWVPSNVKFLVDDVEDTWLNGDNIDFVHLRNMVPILKSPVNLLREAYM